MKRILVIGPGGAGKSTLAKRLGELLQLEVIHLDALYWQPGWVEPSKTEWAATVEQLVSGEAWVMDGNYSGTLEPRLAACDTVIFLDLPPHTCVWRVLKRWRQYRRTTRPDMAAGCHEQLSLEFLLWIWNYRRRTRPRVLKLIEQCARHVNVTSLRSAAAVEQYLQVLQASGGKARHYGK